MVNHPACALAGEDLEASAVADQALEFLHLCDRLAQVGAGLQQKAHHVEAGRPHQTAGLQAKAAVLRQVGGGAPQARDVVNRPALLLQLAGRHTGVGQQGRGRYALALRRAQQSVRPATRGGGL